MRALPALAGLLLAACAAGGQPAPAPSPPAGVLVLAAAAGTTIADARTGRARASLPAGRLVYHLSGGGDLDEAYLVSGAGGSFTVSAVLPARGYQLAPVAQEPGSVEGAALVPAPGLTTFVGLPTVLLVLGAGGALDGYQHGRRIWSDPPEPLLDAIAVVGGGSFLGYRDGGWRWFDPVIGQGQNSISPGGPCPLGPVAVVSGFALVDCGGTVYPGAVQATLEPSARPFAFAAGAANYLAFPDGGLWHASRSGISRASRGPAWEAAVPPVAAPDGSGFYAVTKAGVEKVRLDGSHQRVAPGAGVASIATSRDGNFLYLLGGGRVVTYPAAGGAAAGSFATDADAILVAAGG